MSSTQFLKLNVKEVHSLVSLILNNAKENLEVYDKLTEFLADSMIHGKKILLSNGKWTFVSDEDFDYLAENDWGCNQEGYVVCIRGPLDGTLMHHFIGIRTNFKIKGSFGHLDGNKRNNQRGNLGYAEHRH